jgi:hypothetical protein
MSPLTSTRTQPGQIGRMGRTGTALSAHAPLDEISKPTTASPAEAATCPFTSAETSKVERGVSPE